MDITVEFRETLTGACDACLGVDCGDKGSVRIVNSPFEMGRRCVEVFAAAISDKKNKRIPAEPKLRVEAVA